MAREDANDPKQVSLFDTGEKWEHVWQGMPEYVQEDLEPYKSVLVHFESRADFDAFQKLVGQKMTMDTRSIWYPEAEFAQNTDKRWVDPGDPPADGAER